MFGRSPKKESKREARKRGKREGWERKNKSCRDSCKVGIEKQTKWLVPCHVFWCTPAAFVPRCTLYAGVLSAVESSILCPATLWVYILFHFVVSSAELRQKYWGISKNCCTICSKCCCAARVDDVENCQTENCSEETVTVNWRGGEQRPRASQFHFKLPQCLSSCKIKATCLLMRNVAQKNNNRSDNLWEYLFFLYVIDIIV